MCVANENEFRGGSNENYISFSIVSPLSRPKSLLGYGDKPWAHAHAHAPFLESTLETQNEVTYTGYRVIVVQGHTNKLSLTEGPLSVMVTHSNPGPQDDMLTSTRQPAVDTTRKLPSRK